MADLSRVSQMKISPVGQQPAQERISRGERGGASFRSTLDKITQQGLEARGLNLPAPLKFSSHAIERMRTRGISYTPEQMKHIENAVSKAQQKGARSTLLLAGDTAMIVNPENRTVVTVMDKSALKENVFTNIDSTVVI